MGLDGQSKMSKSMGNTIGLLESPESIWAKLRPAMTDPKRIRRTDPGTPEVCNIYHLHKAFSPPATVEHVAMQCTTAGWGCIDCKKVLAESMETELVPIRRRAAELADKPDAIDDALAAGGGQCRAIGARDDERRPRPDGFLNVDHRAIRHEPCIWRAHSFRVSHASSSDVSSSVSGRGRTCGRSSQPSAALMFIDFTSVRPPIHRDVSANGVRVFSLCGGCGARLQTSATLCEECAQKRESPSATVLNLVALAS